MLVVKLNKSQTVLAGARGDYCHHYYLAFVPISRPQPPSSRAGDQAPAPATGWELTPMAVTSGDQ